MPTALYVDSPLESNELWYKNINYEKMFPALFCPLLESLPIQFVSLKIRLRKLETKATVMYLTVLACVLINTLEPWFSRLEYQWIALTYWTHINKDKWKSTPF